MGDFFQNFVTFSEYLNFTLTIACDESIRWKKFSRDPVILLIDKYQA